MKKILALVLTLTMICSMLVSCANVESMIAKADAALQEAPYTINMKMNFECDDKKLSSIFSAMNMEFPITVDGKDIAMDISMEMMGYSADVKMIVADMVMYYDVNVLGQSVKMKATMTDEEYKEFAEENNTEMAVKPEDFGKLTVETKDGKKYITCSEISEEGLEELNDVMKKTLETVNGKAEVSNVAYTIILNKGKYEAMDMTCSYSVTVGGETFKVTMKMNAEYSYDNVAEITAPQDAGKYQEVKFSDLMK